MKGRIMKTVWRKKATVLACVVVATVMGASTAVAANGSNFILGVLTNTATATTQLAGTVEAPLLRLVNRGTAPGATALDIGVPKGKPPLTTNEGSGTATNLSADKLDRRDSTEFFPGGNLPSGTIRGVYDITWTADAAGEENTDSISFGWTLLAAPVPHTEGVQPTAECPGSVNAPEAAPGHLCIYVSRGDRIVGPRFDPAPTRYGAVIRARSSGAGLNYISGTWAVTPG